jgi:hypothetical protein
MFATPLLPRNFTNVKSGKMGAWKVWGKYLSLMVPSRCAVYE